MQYTWVVYYMNKQHASRVANILVIHYAVHSTLSAYEGVKKRSQRLFFNPTFSFPGYPSQSVCLSVSVPLSLDISLYLSLCQSRMHLPIWTPSLSFSLSITNCFHLFLSCFPPSSSSSPPTPPLLPLIIYTHNYVPYLFDPTSPLLCFYFSHTLLSIPVIGDH